MKKTTHGAALIVALGLALATPLALAQGMGGPHCRPGFGMPGPMEIHGALARLDLDDAQRDAIHALFDEFRPRIDEAQGVVEKFADDLHEVAVESGYSDGSLRPIAEAMGDAIAEATLLRIEMHSKVRELLTPEQIETLETFRDRRDGAARFGGRHHGHGPQDGSGRSRAPGGGN